VSAPDPEPVLEWGRANLRDLPWRATRDPWAVLVSEVMAQQTQVDRVVPKWEAFLDRWPDPSSCAQAELSEVLVLWSGLGYPRRARNLHAASRVIVERHGGAVPVERDALLALPGVGPYTAAAVRAFAFEVDEGVVDTNIARVLARWSGRRLGQAEVRRIAGTLVPDGRGWWWNQTLMELGARCCRPRAPRCGACPLAPGCAWHLAGHAEPDPALGSALVSGRQGRFEGSNRQLRGRALAALAEGPLHLAELVARLGLDDARAGEVVASLRSDGLVTIDGGDVRLG
jgi:A/G-specific adenine glycosylase